MDTGFMITWKELLIAGIIVLVVFVVGLLLRHRTQNKDLAEIKARLALLEARFAHPTENDPLADTISIGATPYSQAFILAQEGLEVTQVAARCGISHAEAELIVAMQNKPQR